MASRRELHNLYTNRRWKRRGRAEKRLSPICVTCWESGIVNPAEVSHHTESFGEDRHAFFYGPVISLCRDHHEQEHGRPARRPYDTTIDASGWPIDPAHPSNQTELPEVTAAKLRKKK